MLGGADLDHLDITERTVGRALSYGEAAVAEIHQHLASLQVVPCERLGEITLRSVRQHQQGEIIHTFQSFQVFHQWERILRPLILMPEIGDVVDDHDLGTGVGNHPLDRVAEGELERSILGKVSIRIDLHAEEVIAENIRFSIVAGVSTLELLIVQFEIAVDHFLRPGFQFEPRDGTPSRDAVGDLHRQDGLAHVGIGKEDAEFLLVPELTEQHPGDGSFGSLFDPAVRGLDLKKSSR